jgi:hypothetical protein
MSVWGAAAFLAIGYFLLTGLLGEWGRWYSPNPPFRMQTDALMAGQLAVSHSPADIQHDFAWAEGGVQQVWGLGVAFWRLPFEVLARIAGQSFFPDRVVLLVAFGIVASIAIRVMLIPSEVRTVSGCASLLRREPLRLAAVVTLIFFPPMVTLCVGPFNVYEEAVFYGYLSSITVFLLLLSLTRTPRWKTYLALSFVAGIMPLVRATIGCYGLVGFVLASLIAKRTWGWRSTFVGLLIFALGSGIVFWTNFQRFGSGFEFGHALNLSTLDLIYASRFVAPYNQEPLVPAALELCGSIFGVLRLNGFDCYGSNVVMFQSDTPRWRYFYGITFDGSYLIALCGLSVWGVREIRDRLSRRTWIVSPVGVSTVWSIACIGALAAFYLRFHAMSSRYVLDFAPAFAVWISAGLLQLSDQTSSRRLLTIGRQVGVLLVLAVWWLSELYLGGRHFDPTPVYSRAEVDSRMPEHESNVIKLPREYDITRDSFDNYGIPQNLRGWHWPEGDTTPIVIFFVDNMSQLVLDVEPRAADQVAENDYLQIQAKVGLESLQLESIERTPLGRRLYFGRPKREKYRIGIQVVFLALAPPEDFLDRWSKFRLVRVLWHDADTNDF